MRRRVAAAAVAAALVTACAGEGGAARPPATTSTTATTTTMSTTQPPADVAVPSAGCGTSTAAATSLERRTVDVDGAERWYLLTVPDAHDGRTPLPLVVDLHGFAEGAELHARMSGFGDLAGDEGFVAAFPHGSQDPARWDVTAPPAPNPDLAFVDQLLDALGRDLCLDMSRTYVAGLSYGAIMASFLACHRAGRVAAVAAVAGVVAIDDCPRARPVPVVAFHGTDDRILLFNGGVGPVPGLSPPADPATTTTLAPADLDGPGYPATVARWASSNGCEPAPTDETVSDEVVHRTYDCPAGGDVELYVVVGGGHAWPGSDLSASLEAVIGPTTFDVSATAEAWAFFRRFRLPP